MDTYKQRAQALFLTQRWPKVGTGEESRRLQGGESLHLSLNQVLTIVIRLQHNS